MWRRHQTKDHAPWQAPPTTFPFCQTLTVEVCGGLGGGDDTLGSLSLWGRSRTLWSFTSVPFIRLQVFHSFANDAFVYMNSLTLFTLKSAVFILYTLFWCSWTDSSIKNKIKNTDVYVYNVSLKIWTTWNIWKTTAVFGGAFHFCSSFPFIVSVHLFHLMFTTFRKDTTLRQNSLRTFRFFIFVHIFVKGRFVNISIFAILLSFFTLRSAVCII